jgi:hypothetical protein
MSSYHIHGEKRRLLCKTWCQAVLLRREAGPKSAVVVKRHSPMDSAIAGLTRAALYRLTTDDNALRKGWHMPPKLAAECTWLFNTNVPIFPYLLWESLINSLIRETDHATRPIHQAPRYTVVERDQMKLLLVRRPCYLVVFAGWPLFLSGFYSWHTTD